VLEITLRTKAALECIRAIIAEVEGAIVGAGTVLDGKKLRETEHIGCAFAVSPGSTRALLDAAEDTIIPLLPGSATATECMSLMDRGYRFQKFFPAEPAGGLAYLASLASPLPQVRFCPTGGITLESAPRYLKLSTVITVGGSWMAPKKSIEVKDWKGIEALARQAAQLIP
jgi:2-dehydro-3-deoxyphosphogluconate aldolase/(4S)-4-hydroxy-2-oxoglutarate aldolase